MRRGPSRAGKLHSRRKVHDRSRFHAAGPLRRCRRPAGQPNFGRPAFSHLLCYSRGVRDQPSPAYPDVLPATGKMTWSQAMGVAACELACRYVLTHTSTRTIVSTGTTISLSTARRRG